MRTIILFVAIVFGVMGVKAQVTVFTETFDNAWYALNIPTSTWSSDQGAASASAWHRNDVTTNWSWTQGSPIATGANSTTYYARFHTYGINNLSTSLTTGNIDLSSYVSCSLTFYYINPTGSDNLNVYFSNDGGVTWSSAVGTYGVQATTWNQKTIAIPVGYQVSNFRIKYTATSDYGNDDIGLDQVVVTGTLGAPCSTVPTLAATTAASSISGSGASSGGNVTSAGTGGCTVTARGVCWSTSSGPTIANSKTSDGTGTGSFTSSITGLTANTTFYVRSYTTNGFGTGYGAEISFTTAAPCTTVPVLAATTAATSITSSGASSGGNVTSAGTGGCTVTARGVCWGTSANPTLGAGNYTTDGTGTGTFTSTITGLFGNTLYYVRSYATNGNGTGYGAQISFTTAAASYCIPTYSGHALDDFISNVNIPTTTLNNTTTGSNFPVYTLFSQSGSTTASLTQGNTYTLNVTGGNSNCYIAAWIDYNNDGVFNSTNEFIGQSANCKKPTAVELISSWTIPVTSATGPIRMRLRTSYNSPGPAAGESCGNVSNGVNWGEAEDYILTIVASVTPTIVLSTNNVAAGNIAQASTNNPIYSFGISPTVASASLTGLTVTTTGTYASTDIANLKCYYQSSSSFNAGTATLLSTLTTPGTAGAKIFPSFTSQTIAKDATGYIFITADVACAATTKTLAINAVTGTNTTFALGTATGTPAAGNMQTISALASVANVTGAAASVAVSSSVVSWTNVSCFDEVLIVAAAGSNSGTPSGDGTAYTANLAYSSGTTLGDGFVVYKGSSATATVTG
ncbi:MAG: GEVED domain-containing protein, partial [Bacteroidales bacterium]|nr:GEVED domain-containing protein [Bacteroidales bacterium]